MRRARFFSFLVLPPLFLLLAAFGLFAYEINRPGPHDGDHRILIERGIGLGRIAHQLQTEGVVRHGFALRLAGRIIGADRALRAGEYEIAAHASILQILENLQYGAPLLRRLTLPEGLTSRQIITLLEGADGLVGEIVEIPSEGSLLPETYYYSYGDARSDLVHRMQEAQTALLDRLWPERAAELPFDSRSEAVTLASIIEKETAIASERPLIASVFINRLRKGMRLQSDPTVIYGVSEGLPLGRPILRSELRQETPFNTYAIRGLPPHPIANPGELSIRAALNPATSDYLYFVAAGDGGHAFARSLREHNDNVARWRRLQKESAISEESDVK
ncbi:hypothetical protein AQ1_01681 [alpha proteobacterium Q-1]|uniref:endolytic transglycosylase MltG n=1 Tax=Iodidimonas nitroreducens TaxID=1236968 RepID=UPI00049ED3D1|nr:endolytic transglycosylase MltG [Iodidimonas nitroreducens]GAK33790.1 hypothetical protein AQ1_01681 [alpha proteobacterium Q-1]